MPQAVLVELQSEHTHLHQLLHGGARTRSEPREQLDSSRITRHTSRATQGCSHLPQQLRSTGDYSECRQEPAVAQSSLRLHQRRRWHGSGGGGGDPTCRSVLLPEPLPNSVALPLSCCGLLQLLTTLLRASAGLGALPPTPSKLSAPAGNTLRGQRDARGGRKSGGKKARHLSRNMPSGRSFSFCSTVSPLTARLGRGRNSGGMGGTSRSLTLSSCAMPCAY